MPHSHFITKTTVVASAGTTSDKVDLEAYDIVGVFVPTIDNATFKIQVSQDGTNFFDVYDSTGTQQLTWAASTGARFLSAISTGHLLGAHYARIVLGAAQNGGARTFTWVFKDSYS